MFISPWSTAKVDHAIYTFDSINRFIEDLFMGGARLDPATDGRPDPRPAVRESTVAPAPKFEDTFDFSLSRPPLFLAQ
jgi:hypothetical protein